MYGAVWWWCMVIFVMVKKNILTFNKHRTCGNYVPCKGKLFATQALSQTQKHFSEFAIKLA